MLITDPSQIPTEFGGPYRVGIGVAKYNNGRTPDDGEPDEVVFVSQWFERDGTPIDDEQRIAELDAANPVPEVDSG